MSVDIDDVDQTNEEIERFNKKVDTYNKEAPLFDSSDPFPAKWRALPFPTTQDKFTMAALTGLCANPNLMSMTEFGEISEGVRGGKHFVQTANALAKACMKERQK